MLQVNFIMIYIIHKISVLLKVMRILKPFLKSVIDFLSFFKKKYLFFFTTYNNEMFKSQRRQKYRRKHN